MEQIVEQNNRAALDSMMRGLAVEEAQSPQPEAWALSLLADILKVGPPLLSEIIDCLGQIKNAKEFLSLVRILLPEYEADIMAEVRRRRVYKFCYFFGRKYYPLPANTDCPPDEWINGMPVQLLAMSYSSYHELGMRPGYLLLLSLVVYPYEGDERDMEDDDVPFDPFDPMKNMEREWEKVTYKPAPKDVQWLRSVVEPLVIGGEWIAPMGFKMVKLAENKIKLTDAADTPEVRDAIRRTLLVAEKAGIKAEFKTTGRTSEAKLNGARVPLLDTVQNMVGADLASRIPADGWNPVELHQMTDNTPYDGAGDFADWVFSQTECVMLDASYENCDYQEGYGEPMFRWTKRNVDILTEQWPKVKRIRGKIDHIVEWLEADQINHFAELLEFLLKSKPDKYKKKLIHRYDPMEHICELDQDTGEEDDDRTE